MDSDTQRAIERPSDLTASWLAAAVGAALGLYEREVLFYQDIAHRPGGPVAPCYHASADAVSSTGVFALLLGDGREVVGWVGWNRNQPRQ